ncbi:hypothetical protein V8G54_019967 [Vigna mungo]|uniref:Uncharacterized protein n=1 Tax=Vigna mungo TaxID=3915 RepID=A0AAQ3NCS8_VIGMU
MKLVLCCLVQGHSKSKSIRYSISEHRQLNQPADCVSDCKAQCNLVLSKWLLIDYESCFGQLFRLLQNNNISGPIPSELGKLPKLQTLDLSNNFFRGEIPQSLGHLKSLQYL